jgi:hypothetical protein
MLILEGIREHVRPIEQSVREGAVFLRGVSRSEVQHVFAGRVLRPMLPARYSLQVGRPFSIDDLTAQDDGILICDAHYALPMGRLVPCEIVYAMCEVTPVLDRSHFESCVLNLASFKALHRAEATAHDVSPTQHLSLFGARYAQLSDSKLNPYLGYIFADHGEDAVRLIEALNAMLEEKRLEPDQTPDAVLCLRDGWLISRQTRTGDPSVPRSSFAKFGIWRSGEDSLALAYVLLNLSLSQIQLRAPDLLRPLTALTRAH